MVEFQRMSMGRDSFGVNFAYYEAVGLPKGVKCQVLPEEADRPRGDWYVACRGGTKKRIIRCKSKADAIEKATAWCLLAAAGATTKQIKGLEHAKLSSDSGKWLARPAKRKVAK